MNILNKESIKQLVLTPFTLGLTNTLKIVKLYAKRKPVILRLDNRNIYIRNNLAYLSLYELLRKNMIIGYDNDELILSYFGYKLRIHKDHLDEAVPLIEQKEDEYGNTIKYEGKKVLDIGAHIGDTALWFLYKGASSVVALEPDPFKFTYLKKNIDINGLNNKIKAINAGLWYYDGRITLFPSNNIIVLTLKSIIEENGSFDLIKMDCEGCEFSLIKEECSVLNQAGREYLIEVHGYPDILIDKFKSCGYNSSLQHITVENYVLIYHFYT